MTVFLGLMIPFLGTTLGAACVFFLKNALGTNVQKALLGFASGVMVAASVWSLLIPSMDLSASIMCMENKMPMLVFLLNEENSIVRAAKGDINGTKVTV